MPVIKFPSKPFCLTLNDKFIKIIKQIWIEIPLFLSNFSNSRFRKNLAPTILIATFLLRLNNKPKLPNLAKSNVCSHKKFCYISLVPKHILRLQDFAKINFWKFYVALNKLGTTASQRDLLEIARISQKLPKQTNKFNIKARF